MKTIITLIVPLMLSVGSLWGDAPVLSDETKLLLKEAKSEVEPIAPQRLKTLMDEGKIVLVDVRDPDEWEKNSIAYDRQVKISRGFLEIKYPKLILDKYTKEDTFVFYCGLEPRSVLAAQRMKQLGFKHIMYLEGGLKNFNP